MRIRMRQVFIAVVALVAWAGIVHALENSASSDHFGERETIPVARQTEIARICM